MLFGTTIQFTIATVMVLESVWVRDSLMMVAESYLLVLILINVFQVDTSGLIEVSSVEEEVEDNVLATIKLHRDDIRNFFSVRTINFCVANNKKWMDIYEAMVKEFQEEFSFSVINDQFDSLNSTFLSKFSSRGREVEREGFVVSVGLHERVPEQLELFLLRDNAYYLVIVEERQRIDDLSLLQNFQSVFRKTGSIMMMAIYNRQIVSFNPFAVSPHGSYGSLEPFHRSTRSLKHRLLRNLNGYPLKVEFFDSGYNVQFYKDAPWAKTYLDQFTGPDAANLAILRSAMNFTGKKQYNIIIKEHF